MGHKKKRARSETMPVTTTFDAEAEELRLQQLTAEMTESWSAREWGANSLHNFICYLRWLLEQLQKLTPP